MKKLAILVSLLIVAGLLLAACGQQAPQTVVVTQIVEKNGEQVVVTQVVEVTPTPPPEPVTLNINWAPNPRRLTPAWRRIPLRWLLPARCSWA